MANLFNPEYKKAKIIDSFVSWETSTAGKQFGGIVFEVEFEDGKRMQKKYLLTENASAYTFKTIKELGFKGSSITDFAEPQLVGQIVSVTIADATDQDGNIRYKENGDPIREIAFINPQRGYKRASRDELASLAHHFDKYLIPPKQQPQNSADDDDLPF